MVYSCVELFQHRQIISYGWPRQSLFQGLNGLGGLKLCRNDSKSPTEANLRNIANWPLLDDERIGHYLDDAGVFVVLAVPDEDTVRFLMKQVLDSQSLRRQQIHLELGDLSIRCLSRLRAEFTEE